MTLRFDTAHQEGQAESLRWHERMHHSGHSFLLYKYRYLVCFIGIGVLSIAFELAFHESLKRLGVPWSASCGVSFLSGMLLSFVLNASINFRVAKNAMPRTFVIFAAVSTLSFIANLALMQLLQHLPGASFETLRLPVSGALFLVAYGLHRRFTFDQARNFGIAVYANENEDPQRIFDAVGNNCDHVHIDLVDWTMAPGASAVKLEHLDEARKLWPERPIAMHLMSLRPEPWVTLTLSRVDWYLFHVEADDDLFKLIATCRLHRKKVGVVWRPSTPFSLLMPWLPHVDLVMVLGIREPGRSGQQICEESIQAAAVLDDLRHKFGYEVMFDGGVKVTNVAEIRAKYIVAASAVLQAEHPIRASHMLRLPRGTRRSLVPTTKISHT